jgi:hypothetical protein
VIRFLRILSTIGESEGSSGASTPCVEALHFLSGRRVFGLVMFTP